MGAHVGEVRDPEPVGRGGREVALDEIGGSGERLVDERRDAVALAAARPREPEPPHQALDSAARDADPLAVELGPDLVGAVDGEVGCVDPGDLDLEIFVAQGARRRRTLPRHPVGVRGNLATVLGEHPTDRLDPEARPVGVDEGHYLGDRRSSSAPKKLAAAFKISLARLSSRFSLRSSLSSARSSVVTPGRRPESTSARRTQIRSVSWLTPIFFAIEVIAAQSDG